MKRTYMAFIMATVIGLLLLGCSSPAEEAQKMFSEGKYQELVTKFGNDPALASVVEQANDKLAEALLKEGKLEELVVKYPKSKFATQAKEQLAQNLFMNSRFDELMVKYPDSRAAVKFKLAQEKARGDSLAAVSGEQGKALETAGKKIEAQGETIELAAKRELERINNIKNPRLRATELENFIKNPKFKGTQAVKDASKK
jgi:hypothetical protein